MQRLKAVAAIYLYRDAVFPDAGAGFHSQFLDCQGSWVRSASIAECTGFAGCTAPVGFVGTDSFLHDDLRR